MTSYDEELRKTGVIPQQVSLSHRYMTVTATLPADNPLEAAQAFHSIWVHVVDEMIGGTEAQLPKSSGTKTNSDEAIQREAGEKGLEEGVGELEVGKFHLQHVAQDKYQLDLYPVIGGKPGEYAEIKFSANKESMWKMLAPVWEETWEPGPQERPVAWSASYRLGREYLVQKGKNKGQTRRYKDLVSLSK